LTTVWKILFSRIFFIGILILLQILALIIVVWKFSSYFVYFYAICLLLSIVAVFHILVSNTNPVYKIAWIVPILLFPIFGGLFYLLCGGHKLSKRSRMKMHQIDEQMKTFLAQDEAILQAMAADDKSAANQARYILNSSHCPIYQNTTSVYLPTGEIMFERLIEELKNAKRYIFLEYFIIDKGIMWDTILDILVEKVKQGVDVRLIYDDVGCIFNLPHDYDKQLRKMGIKCCVFNPFKPVLSLHLNHRDHRKMAIIDGVIAFTGGINLADEYNNAYERFGYWKDSAIMIKGEAVWTFTVMFLTLWNYIEKSEEDYNQFRPEVTSCLPQESAGYVQPFGDSPLDDEPVGETVYLNLISKAKDYIYITTPYLILDNKMTNALITAAKQNIDVRIATPHIPDKWYVHCVTRANYDLLVENGVKIYEYTPGFLHAKSFIVDDKYAVVGSINLDYRSLYLHFECGVWLYKTDSVLQIKKDFMNILEQCQQITLEDCRSVEWYRRLGRLMLSVFAPLL